MYALLIIVLLEWYLQYFFTEIFTLDIVNIILQRFKTPLTCLPHP